MPTTRVGVQAVTGSTGQVVDIDPARISATITNVGAVGVEYSTNSGSNWTSIAASGSASLVTFNTNEFRLRRATAGGYPTPVDIEWTAQSEGEANSLTAAQAASVSGAGISPYTGFVATRGIVANNKHGSNKQAMVRTAHYARDTITPATLLQVIFGNFAVLTTSSSPISGSGAETGGGGVLTVEASIEYPIGTTPTRITFSGSNQGSIPDAGSLICDPITGVSIPKDAKFYIRAFYNFAGAGTVVFTNMPGNSNNFGLAMGEGAEFAASGLTNKVMSGTITSAGGANIYPLGIIGTTSRHSVYIISDSRDAGQGDTADTFGDIGFTPRAVGRKYAYAAAAIPSDRASWANANFTERAKLAKYASIIYIGDAINDLNGGALTAPQTLTALQTLWALVRAAANSQARIFQATLAPSTTSSDSWATVANQTVSGYEAARLTLNGNFRSTAYANLDGFVDIDYAVSSGFNSGKWQPLLTADGIHGNVAATTLPQTQSSILAALGLA